MFINSVPSLVFKHEYGFLLDRVFFCHGNDCCCVLCEVHTEAKATVEYGGAWLSFVLSMRFMIMSRDQNTGQSHSMKTDNSSIERVEEFKY